MIRYSLVNCVPLVRQGKKHVAKRIKMTHALKPVTLDEVDIKAELSRRPYRSPNYEVEHQALIQLADEMANHTNNILQKAR
jgi:hypothetical protein